MMKVIGLVGKAGAGKDTVADIMAERYPSIRMGDVVIEETRRRGLALTDENVGSVAGILRRNEGMDAIAKRCIPKIQALDSATIVVNGIRGFDEVTLFRSHFEDFVVVEVWASDRTRFERILARFRPDDVRDYDEFVDRDQREDSWGLAEAISLASHRICNDGTLASLRARTKEVMDSIEREC